MYHIIICDLSVSLSPNSSHTVGSIKVSFIPNVCAKCSVELMSINWPSSSNWKIGMGPWRCTQVFKPDAGLHNSPGQGVGRSHIVPEKLCPTTEEIFSHPPPRQFRPLRAYKMRSPQKEGGLSKFCGPNFCWVSHIVLAKLARNIAP